MVNLALNAALLPAGIPPITPMHRLMWICLGVFPHEIVTRADFASSGQIRRYFPNGLEIEVDVRWRLVIPPVRGERASGSEHLGSAVAVSPQSASADAHKLAQTRVRHSQASDHIIILKSIGTPR